MAEPDIEKLDRHALVMAIWFAFGLVAATLLRLGTLAESWLSISFGFVTLLAGFIAHVLVNVVFKTRFTPREVALGLFVYAICLLWLGMALLFDPQFRAGLFLPFALGLLGLTAAVIFTMITWLGLRGAFESFDIIRRFAPEPRR